MKSISYKNPRRVNRKLRLTVALLILFGILIFFTQSVAHKFNYHQALGKPIIGKFYNPVKAYSWYQKYYKKYPQVFEREYAKTFVLAMFIVFSCFIILLLRQRMVRGTKDIHGSARFAKFEDIKKMKLLEDDAGKYEEFIQKKRPENKPSESKNEIILGGFVKNKFLHYLRSSSPENVLVVAPPRSGKGICIVIPTALTNKQSMLIMDLKQEIYQLTAGARKAAGHKVLRFAPGSLDGSCRINPFSEIRIGTIYEISEAQNIATTILDPDGKGMQGIDGHFQKKARNFISAVILHNLYNNPETTLTDLAYFISTDINNRIDKMINNTDCEGKKHRYISAAAESLKAIPERERGSIISTAEALFEIYKDPIVEKNITDANFKIDELMDGDRPVTLYICIEPKDQSRLNPLIRIIMNQMIFILTKGMEFKKGEQVKRKHQLLLLWDEFTAMGKMEFFEKQLAYLPGYGIRALLVVQDLSQLHKTYSKDESFTSLCSILAAFAPSKFETADLLSKMSGETTVIKKSVQRSGTVNAPILKNVAVSAQEHKRYLITPNELQQLKSAEKDNQGRVVSPGKMVIFMAGHPVILGTQILYFQDPIFLSQTKIPPPINA